MYNEKGLSSSNAVTSWEGPRDLTQKIWIEEAVWSIGAALFAVTYMRCGKGIVLTMTYMYLPKHSSKVPEEQDARHRNLIGEGVTPPEGGISACSLLLWEIGCCHITYHDCHSALSYATQFRQSGAHNRRGGTSTLPPVKLRELCTKNWIEDVQQKRDIFREWVCVMRGTKRSHTEKLNWGSWMK